MTSPRISRLVILGVAAALLAFGLRPQRSHAQVKDGVVVVVNARNPTQRITKSEATKLFLGQQGFWHGVVPVRLYVRPDDSASAKAFYSKVLGLTPVAFRNHWDKLQLSGRAVAPEIVGPLDEVVKKVGATPGAVGFALASETWSIELKGVKLIEVN